MEVYRLSRQKFAQKLSGKGAALKGARWNSVGVEMIYTAANRSLAMAEVAVHLTIATIPDDYVMMTLFIPDDIFMEMIDAETLAEDWNAFPHTKSTQSIGDKFVLQRIACLLKVPSAVTRGDYNILINPNHPDFKRVQILATEKFPFDKRIFK